MRMIVRGVVPVVVLLAVLSGGGCSFPGGAEERSGFAARPGRAILLEAFDDTGTPRAMRIRAQLTLDGYRVDYHVASDRSGACRARVRAYGGFSRWIFTDGQSLVQGDRAFWKKTAPLHAGVILADVRDRWVRMPADHPMRQLCSLGPRSLAGMRDRILADKGGGQVGEYSSVGDERVIEINDGKRDPETLLLVQVEDPHHIRQVVSREPGDPLVVTFSDFEATPRVTPPPERRIVDLDTLIG